MFSYLVSFFNYLFLRNNSDGGDSDEEGGIHFLANELIDLELMEDDQNDEYNSHNEVAVPSEKTCFQKSGVVTYLNDNCILVDGVLYFDLSKCKVPIHLNDKISYLGYEEDDGAIKIVRILDNLGTFWGDEINSEEERYQVKEHVILGEVDGRKDRQVYMKDNDLVFNLDEVEANFVPIKGDWLELKCTIQWDENKPTDVSAKQVVNVISLKPIRTKINDAIVTYWNGEEGTCDRDIYFQKHSLHNGCVLEVGSKVLLEAIESNQGNCIWRAIKMIPDEKIKPPIPNDKENQSAEEKASLNLEKQLNIDMTYPLHFDNIVLNENSKSQLTIANNSNETYELTRWVVLGKKKDSQIIIKPFVNQPVKILPKKSFKLQVMCQPKFLGHSLEKLVIIFKGFQLKRHIHIDVACETTYRDNGYSNGRYRPNYVEEMKSVRSSKNGSFVPGVRPVKPPAFIPVRLGSFDIPDKVWNAVLGDSDQTIYSEEYNSILDRIECHLPTLRSDLRIQNYSDRWHTLLYMEEIQQNIHMRSYDMPKAYLMNYKEFLSLEIKGLSERRPSLVIGDKVIATDKWDEYSPQYEGFIHDIKGDLILLKFNVQFHESYSGGDVALEFHFSRTMFRKCHQAINLAFSNLGPDLLFPSRVIVRQPLYAPEMIAYIAWFNENLNEIQKTAVANILTGECRPMPYCIYGPPGTGKTVTTVEAILQILTHIPDSRILVATPSNSAANLITERLLQYRDSFSESLVRLLANYLVNSDNIPDSIKPFCATLDIARENTSKSKYRVNENGINLDCPTSFIGRHRVTIGTCCCLGALSMMGLPRGHFTHVIVDEAGQATEPEIMIPLTFTDKENGQIVLAGDPMQLGPVVISKYAKDFGMDESFLSRILDRFPYQKDFHAYKQGYDSRLVTMLTHNYRSLENILELPSKLFYDGALVPRINKDEPWIVKIAEAVAEIFSVDDCNGGIYVYGIRGCNMRAEDSPSWYNPQEASMVALTTCKLYKKGITPDEIGIIAPYIAQIKHLRLVFDAMGLDQPKIGTVEEFQGQERPIILISTVRSSKSHIDEDVKHTLGFVRNPKRFNVALTRAQVAVMLFCDPHLIITDNLWSKVLTNAVNQDKYAGCDLPPELTADN